MSRINREQFHQPFEWFHQTTPNEIIKQKLYKIGDKYCPPFFIDLAVGARVMTKNLATQIWIYSGTTGTFVAFGFPEDTFHTLKDREIPIVLVKMDKCTGA